MSTYAELKAQADALNAQADQLKAIERNDAISQARGLVAMHGLTADELGLSKKTSKTKRKQNAGTFAVAKYRGPNGELWAGGKGRRPEWVRNVLAAGGTLDAYAI